LDLVDFEVDFSQAEEVYAGPQIRLHSNPNYFLTEKYASVEDRP
jgi:hypothetical protein